MTNDTLPAAAVSLDRSPGPQTHPTPLRPPSARRAPALIRAVSVAGRGLLILGGLVVAFLVFQLWGTGFHEQRAQRDLAAELDRAIGARQAPAGPEGGEAILGPVAQGPGPDAGLAPGPGSVAGAATVPARTPPQSAEPVARITAPTIGLDKIVVEGVGRSQLREGPGHYPVTPLPGHAGNVAIAGHRTTHGAPFADIDQLEPGDPIVLDTVDGRFVYRVEAYTHPVEGTVSGHQVVAPGDADAIAATGDNRLTLTTCHPRYSDRQRLVVTATLEGGPVAFAQPLPGAPPSPAGPDASVDTADAADPAAVVPSVGPSGPAQEPFGWHWSELDEVLLWAALTTVCAAPAVVINRRGKGHKFVLLALSVPALPLLLMFVHLDILLPTG